MREYLICIIISLILIGSCATVKEQVVVKTKIIVPEFSCPVPKDVQSKMKSILECSNESELMANVTYNVLILQQNNYEWLEYHNCINTIIKKYKEKLVKDKKL